MADAIELYDYQKEALLKLRTGSILCGGTGSGKSRVALSYYFSVVCNGVLNPYKKPTRLKPLYIITTARKRDTKDWEEELIPFDISVGNGIVVDSWNNIKKYVDVVDAFFIFDEQRVVGSGKWARTFVKISKRNDWILLSATPGDTWMDYVSVFVANGYYKNRSEFVREHVLYNNYTTYPKIEKFVNTKKLFDIRNKILVPMNYTKRTVQHHIPTYVDYDDALYKSIMKTRQNPYQNNEPIRDAAALVYILRRLVNTDESRVEAVKELLQKNDRAVIFYSFDYELEILRSVCRSLGVPIGEWNGHVHNPLPRTKRWAYLVQYTAGCEGWNCTETDCLIFYSQSYSYKVMVQASGRIDRLTTPYKDLYYYHLQSRSGIDRAISGALSKKQTFNERAFTRKMSDIFV